MPTYRLEGNTEIQLTDHMRLHALPTARGTVVMPDAPDAGVLGTSRALPSVPHLPMRDFVPAQPPIELHLEPLAPPPETLSRALPAANEMQTGMAALTFEPDPGEQSVYALLHEIETPEGIIYDVTVPQSGVRGLVLGSSPTPVVSGPLSFPVHRVLNTQPGTASGRADIDDPDDALLQSNGDAPLVLGSRSLGDVVANVTGGAVIKHVLHLVKAPLATSLEQQIASFEGEPRVLQIDRDGVPGEPLEGFAAWRQRFDPARAHRVLLYIHGFNSSIESNLPRSWMRDFGSQYDAVLGYDHPTFATDPLRNATDLRALIPDDVQLNVDILAHSRGGLVARSLTELLPAHPRLDVRNLMSYGSPHAGTSLAEHGNWDRMISLGFTALSWLGTATGIGATAAFLPRGLELLLRAASQAAFSLPGVDAMRPGSEFLTLLNAPSFQLERTRYGVIISNFEVRTIALHNFRRALRSLAAQVFFDQPNDLVVATPSMRGIDTDSSGNALLGNRIYLSNVDHFSYFDHPEHQAITARFLFGHMRD